MATFSTDLKGFIGTGARTQKKDLGKVGEFSKWSPIEIELTGPDSESDAVPNPFATLVDVCFEAPDGERFFVPAFYDGDGEGGPDGPVWKIRFSADQEGTWRFRSSSFHPRLTGYEGTLSVSGISPEARGFYRWGRLEAIGTVRNGFRYLKFRDGPFWLKAGCDDPENFLGRAEHFNTLEERIGTIDYLAAKGVNSLYLMTHNLDGDDNDVWPWLGSTAEKAKLNGGEDTRFDVGKLHEWRHLFLHMQRAGVVPYMILEDDSAWSGYDHGRYYREMVARFGDLPALLFNLGEEHNENYTTTQALAYMQQLAHLDPYGHPRGIHNVNSPVIEYVDARQVDFTSIQTTPETPLTHNQIALGWLDLSKARHQRPLMVGIDEGRPEERRQEWWETYLAGGVWEVHVKPPYDRPLSSWDTVWSELGGTRTFMESIPFWKMSSYNALVHSGDAFCLAAPPEIYVLYLPRGGEVVVDLHADFNYQLQWWNPSNDREGNFRDGGSLRGGRRAVRAPDESDWALRIDHSDQPLP